MPVVVATREGCRVEDFLQHASLFACLTHWVYSRPKNMRCTPVYASGLYAAYTTGREEKRKKKRRTPSTSSERPIYRYPSETGDSDFVCAEPATGFATSATEPSRTSRTHTRRQYLIESKRDASYRIIMTSQCKTVRDRRRRRRRVRLLLRRPNNKCVITIAGPRTFDSDYSSRRPETKCLRVFSVWIVR